MFSVEEVDQFVGTKCWIPTQRFEVVQKNKVRGVDSATVNGVNMATVVTEKIELPSTDVNVAAQIAYSGGLQHPRLGVGRTESLPADRREA